MRALFALLLALVSLHCFAQADYAREQRWADEITPAILVGDPVQLALPAGRKVLGIYAPNSKAQAGVVVVHGLGVHPDWGLINPLRSQLSEQGYATLSVQMPVLAAEAYRKRLVNRVFADEQVEAESYALAQRIADGAPLVARWHKQFIERLTVQANIAPEEWDVGFACFDTDDYREGVRAFLAKTKPEFKGR